MTKKSYVSAQSLLDDSFRLGLKIMAENFHPDYIIGIWRGGTPVGTSGAIWNGPNIVFQAGDSGCLTFSPHEVTAHRRSLTGT